MIMNLHQLQNEVSEWALKNFPDAKPYQPLLGVAEEIGELCHAHLKYEQGIRGTKSEHHVAKIDAVGDTVVFLMHFCGLAKVDLRHGINGMQFSSLFDLESYAKKLNPIESADALRECVEYCGILFGSFSSSLGNKPSAALGLLIKLATYCANSEIDFAYAVEMTWSNVKRRDWQANKQDGGAK